jgi:hypothetical protein
LPLVRIRGRCWLFVTTTHAKTEGQLNRRDYADTNPCMVCAVCAVCVVCCVCVWCGEVVPRSSTLTAPSHESTLYTFLGGPGRRYGER